MKRHWQVRRQVTPHPDGQRRWDRAYQLLLQWEQARPMELTRCREQILVQNQATSFAIVRGSR